MTFPMYENLYMYYHDWVVCSSWDHSPLEWNWLSEVPRLSIGWWSLHWLHWFTIVRGSIFQETGGLIWAYNQGCKSPPACNLKLLKLVDYVDSLELTTLCFLLNESWHICLFTWHLPCSMLVYSPCTRYLHGYLLLHSYCVPKDS